ncbi:MAG: TCP-1/cpn60 chaperonin family protein [Caldilineaceae bacterium]
MRMIATNHGARGTCGDRKGTQSAHNGQADHGEYDVIANDYVDMIQGGIIDPLKVTRSAVENACSIAAMILTTTALVTDIPQSDSAAAGDMGGMGGMGM